MTNSQLFRLIINLIQPKQMAGSLKQTFALEMNYGFTMKLQDLPMFLLKTLTLFKPDGIGMPMELFRSLHQLQFVDKEEAGFFLLPMDMLLENMELR